MKFRKLFFNKWVIILAFLLILIAFLIFKYGLCFTKKSYKNEDFGITSVVSSVDFNGNGIDDYTDILNGAKLEAKNHPKYDGKYYEGGYPPDNIGVCSDVIWRAFRNAGYCLRDMVDKDITLNPKLYSHIEKPDKNIDFRRVKNLKIFFENHAVKLTNDPYDISQWQAGDIVIYNDNHIAIVSDKRNDQGLAYIIHHYGLLQVDLEEDSLAAPEITGHYRFDASLIKSDFLIKWN